LITKIEKAIADSNCDESKTYDAGSVCADLIGQLQVARSDLDKIQALLATLQTQMAAAQQAVAAAKKTEETSDTKKDDDSGSGMTIIIVVCVICATIVIVVVVIAMTGGKGGAAAKQPMPSDRGVVAFENPMYSNANGDANGDANGAVNGADGADGGLYDEPTFSSDATGTEGGYLDVTPDDDDDSDDE